MASPAAVIEMPPQSSGQAAESELKKMANDTPAPSAKAFASMTPSPTVIDKAMSSAANLANLLPTGTVLAFQALSPSFTNRGRCYTSNMCLTAILAFLCATSCVFFAFTDSLIGRDRKLYYGLATFKGFYVFNFCSEEGEREWVLSDLRKLRIRALDFVHAFFAAVLFLTIAFSDSAFQRCFFPDAGANTKELLVNLPLGMGFLSSLVFLIFPTSRKGIGYTDITPHHTP